MKEVLKIEKKTKNYALLPLHQHQSITVDIHGTLNTKVETKCL